jgi:hypothetical protein
MVFFLSGSATFAQSALDTSTAQSQSLRTTSPVSARPIQDSARRAVASFVATDSGEYMPAGMKPRYFWTSIGLISAGGVYLLAAGVAHGECSGANVDCSGITGPVAILGAGLVGGGILLYVLGKKNAAAAGHPSIMFTPQGAALRSTYKF